MRFVHGVFVLVLGVACNNGDYIEDITDCQDVVVTGCEPVEACCEGIKVYVDYDLVDERLKNCYYAVGNAEFDCQDKPCSEADAGPVVEFACDF